MRTTTRTAAILSTLGLLVAATATAYAAPCVSGAVSERCPSWVGIATTDANSTDSAVDIVAAGDGSEVVVLGTQYNPESSSTDLMLVGYAPADGSEAWSTFLGGAARDTAVDLVAGEDVLYVVGTTGADGVRDVLLAAISAGTGEPLWTRQVGSAVVDDVAVGVAVGIDGSAIVGMTLHRQATGRDAVVASYAPDGQLRWQADAGPVDGAQELVDVVVAGEDVVVLSDDRGSGRLAVLAAAGGAPRWSTATEGHPGVLAASDGVAVTAGPSSTGWLVTAHATDTGQIRWTEAVAGASATGEGSGVPADVVFTPDGEHVAVVGTTSGGGGGDMTTAVYDAATGDGWRADFAGVTWRHDRATAASFDAGGGVVYVTGETGRVGAGAGVFAGSNDLGYVAHDVTTLAYDVTSGRQLWAAHHDGPRGYSDEGVAIATTAAGAFVAANTWSESQPHAGTPALQSTGRDITTLAYLTP